MALPVFLACCLKNVSVGKLLKSGFGFSVLFVMSYFYFSLSAFTSRLTCLWVSLIVSSVFMLGITSNIYMRCAAVLFIVQCFSHFGLFMLFLAVSWTTFQTAVGAFLHNQIVGHRMIHELSSTDKISDLSQDSEMEVAARFLGSMHYGIHAPFVGIYLYAVMYEITYAGRNIYSTDNGSKRLFKKLLRGAGLMITVFIGMVFAVTVMMFWVQRIVYRQLIATLNAFDRKSDDLHDMSTTWLGFYLIVCLVFSIIYPFSNYVLKFRHIIIANFLDLSSGLLQRRGDHIYIAKSDKGTNEKNVSEKVKRAKKNKIKKFREERNRHRRYSITDSSDQSGLETVRNENSLELKNIKITENDEIHCTSSEDSGKYIED